MALAVQNPPGNGTGEMLNVLDFVFPLFDSPDSPQEVLSERHCSLEPGSKMRKMKPT